MKKFLINKDSFFKYGYCIVRNLLTHEESERASNLIEELYKKNGQERNEDFYNHNEFLEFIINDRLLNVIKSLIGPKIFYLHTGNTIRQDNSGINFNWHKDNYETMSEINKNEPYNVLTVAIYLSPHNLTKSGINVIPFSHKRYSLSYILSVLHGKIKNIKFLKFFSNLFIKFVGLNIQTDPGDCVIFFSNVLHTALPTKSLRHAILCQYGVDNEYTKNLVDNFIKFRKTMNFESSQVESNKREKYLKILKEKNIYYPLQHNKK